MNKAKREALELLNKFNLDEYLYHTLSFHQAKKCALIAIDEIKKYLSIIEENETADHAFGGDYNGDEYYDYLEEVKKELEKL